MDSTTTNGQCKTYQCKREGPHGTPWYIHLWVHPTEVMLTHFCHMVKEHGPST